MATFDGTSVFFNSTNDALHGGAATGTVDWLSEVIKCDLTTNANAPVVTNVITTDLTFLSGGGYPGSVTLGTKSIDNISGKNWKADAAPIVFTAGAGGITARYWVIWAAGTELLVYGLLNDADADVTVAEGDTITINPHATDGFIKFATSS